MGVTLAGRWVFACFTLDRSATPKIKSFTTLSQITIAAHVFAQPDRIRCVRAELEKRVPLTRAEEGCLQYDLHLDRDDPTHFVFYEKWASREVLQAHINSHPVAAYMKATDGAVRKVLFDEMEAI